MSEKAVEIVISPQKVGKGISFRLTNDQTTDFLTAFSRIIQFKKFWNDWDSFFQGLNDWQFWEPPQMYMLVDDGLGMKGPCKACGFPHIQIYPVKGSPMKCPEALKVDLK